jgi:hypothetical protein
VAGATPIVIEPGAGVPQLKEVVDELAMSGDLARRIGDEDVRASGAGRDVLEEAAP